MDRVFAQFSEKVAGAAGNQYTFFAAILFIFLWGVSGPLFGFSDTWQLVVNTSTTIVTFLMVFLIQNSQNRDSCAIQAKLDTLIDALEDAREDIIGVEHLPLNELEKVRKELEQNAQKTSGS